MPPEGASSALSAAGPARLPRGSRLLAVVFLASIFGLLSCWKVFEYDLFWHVRAGREILETGNVQSIDSWSYTIRGHTWLNFQWLSTVVAALVAQLAPGYAAFSWLRAVLVGLWMGILLKLCVRGPESPVARVLAGTLLAPWAYLICSFRFQMRPDLFAACLFVALLNLLAARLPFTSKAAIGLGTLLVWTNFHSGTAPVGIVVFVSFLLIAERSKATIPARAAWSAAAVLSWFANPHGWRVVTVIWESIVTYDYAATHNPDFRPFSFELLRFKEGGWALMLWFAFALAVFPAYVWIHRRNLRALPGPWRDPPWVLVTGAALTCLTLSKIRSVHYMVAFFLPVAAAALSAAFELAGGTTRSRTRMLAWAAAPLLLFWAWMLPDQIAFVNKPLGTGVLDTELPVHSVEFLKTIQVKPNLLNSHPFGGYLIEELPSLPVSVDGREIPYLKLHEEEVTARLNTDTFGAFLRKWNVNVILETVPGTTFHPQAGFLDTSRLLLPSSEWALVYFDNCSVVYLRRIPEHEAAIREHEYHYLQRGLPANYGAEMQGLPEVTRLGIRLEARRCAQEQPWNVYCHAVTASYLLAEDHLQEALAELELARQTNPNSTEVLLQLKSVYQKLGQPAAAREASIRFARLATELHQGS
jgi:hypothetical protein